MQTEINVALLHVRDLRLEPAHEYCEFYTKYSFPNEEEIIETHKFTYVPQKHDYELFLKARHNILMNKEKALGEYFK